MTLINAIKEDAVLQHLICCECQENKIFVSISYERDKIVILNIDKYYETINTIEEVIQPPSPDCLIIQHIKDEYYKIFIVELKNIKNSKALKQAERQKLPQKYTTCLQDFMGKRFSHYFLDEKYQIDIELIALAGNINEQRVKAVRLDFVSHLPVYQFRNKLYSVKLEIPFPTISKII